MSKKVRIFVSRKITLERDGHEAVVMPAGANLVDADVAAHPFVKAHAVDGASEAADAADAELQAKIAELLAEKGTLEAKVAELQAVVDAFTAATADAGKKK